jgi:hypothetical protein
MKEAVMTLESHERVNKEWWDHQKENKEINSFAFLFLFYHNRRKKRRIVKKRSLKRRGM